MDVYAEIMDGTFAILLVAWFLIETLKQRRGAADFFGEQQQIRVQESASFFPLVTLVINVMMSIMFLGVGVHEYWNHGIVFSKPFLNSVTWVIATVVAFYSGNKGKHWPILLILWWVLFWLVCSISISVYLVNHFSSIRLPGSLPEATYVDFASFPLLSTCLCFNAVLLRSGNKKRSELEQPLLQEKESDGFSNAGIWSMITFRWLNPLFSIGRIEKVQLSHIPGVPQSETAEYASSLLEESLGKRKTERSILPKAIASAVLKSLLINGVFAGVNTITSYVGPLLIKNFVNFLSGEEKDSNFVYGIVLSIIFFVAKTVESLTQRQWYFGARRIGIRVRAALNVLVYKKCLSIQFIGSSSGKIINLINVDVERIGDFCWDIHGVWLLPVQVFLALLILYRNLGAAPSFAALFTTIIVMVSNTPLAHKQEKLHSKVMEAKDARIKATSEILKNMRVLKLYSWESTFLKKLLQLRETEKNWLSRYLYTCAAIAFLFWVSPVLVSVFTFGVCIFLKTPLTTGTVLSALATFKILQEPIYNLPGLISMIAETKVSFDRVQNFLQQEDQKKRIPYHTSLASTAAIELENGEYAWEADEENLKKPTIKITERMKIMKGHKVGVCGLVGSGKSSLLCSIIGEIPRTSGAAIKVNGRKAYVPQSAWIQTGTVRENVLFGSEMNKAFYEDVLQGCALNQDIQLWVDGDLTVIGERGINLSGGQKQRIQLARAVYCDSDVYILDDPFSAVDALTGTHLFKKCLMQLLSGKTVIYATHQLEFLEAADLVLVMKDGMIVESGRYEDLIADPASELVSQMTAHRMSLSQVNPAIAHGSDTGGSSQLSQSEVIEEKSEESIGKKLSPEGTQEDTETGRVKWSVYSTFITSAYKGALVPIILLCQVLFQGLQMGSYYWVAWGSEEKHNVTKEQLIWIFILLCGGSSFFILGRVVLMATVAVKTAQRLFLGMTTSVFRAPISFFDSTPSSRILSRSSTDQSTVDTDIPYRLAGLAFALIQLLSIILLMSHVAWQVFLMFLVVIGISSWYQSYYITTSRELARMIGIRRAPILHHFSESIAGAATIRSFHQEERFFMKVHSLINDYSRVNFHNTATMEWLSVRINFLFNLVFFLVLIILVFLPKSAIDPSLAGLAATYGLNLNVLQAWVIWNLCNVENKMITVERILQFSKIPSEAPLVIEGCRPKPEWPAHGQIELVNLSVQYAPTLPMILKGITFSFPGEKKIGVVGRTGSGKSTLIQALFRVVEPSSGQILIDGLDVCKIGLQDLRSRLGIIPQDPTLFQGTVRTNLDPLQEHSDQEIWEVLNKCQLADVIRQDQRMLDAPVAEDGENWSVGQRQLVCLARVLLKKRRILFLDEATASIDTATDNIIQETIRKETNGCTVITVAHRIPTVIDNDLVLVLDEGMIAEYDSPEQLLKDGSSSFSKLVSEFLRRSSKSKE